MNLQNLPSEILDNCVRFLNHASDIAACRLVSKRLADICAPMLCRSIYIRVSNDTLDSLGTLCQNPLIARSIKTVNFDLSFYNDLFARDLASFAEWTAGDVFGLMDAYDHGDFMPDTFFEIGRKIVRDWTAVKDGSYDAARPTPVQSMLLEFHEEYGRLYEDQELARVKNRYTTGILAMLQRLTGVERVRISDDCQQKLVPKENQPASRTPSEFEEFSEPTLRLECLRALPWKGNFYRPDVDPPVHLLADIFGALAQASISPTAFSACFSPPPVLRVFRSLQEHLHYIRHVLRHAKSVRIWVYSWARQDSLAVNNDRPCDEMQHLGALVGAFCNVEELEHLTLSFEEYPCFTERPQISATKFLALRWKCLQSLCLRNIPFEDTEMVSLVQRLPQTLKRLKVCSLYLLSGSWAQAVEHLRALTQLKEMDFQSPRGAEFGHTATFLEDSKREGISRYILRRGEENPLPDIVNSRM